MFSADADLQIFALRSPALRADTHKLAHAVAIDGDEGIARDKAARQIFRKKASRVVAA